MPLYNQPVSSSIGVNIEDFGTIGTADDTAVFAAALNFASAAGKTLYLPTDSTVTTDTYAIQDGTSPDIACNEGRATIRTLALNQKGIIKRDIGLNSVPFFRANGIIFQGNGKEGTEQQIVATHWVSSGNVGSWVQLADVSGYVLPNTHGLTGNPAINCHKVLAGDNIRADFNYTGINTGTKRLTGTDINMTIAGTDDNGDPEDTVGYWVDQSATKVCINLDNVNNIDISDCEFYDWFSAAISISNGVYRRIEHNRIERCGQSTNGRNVINVIVDEQHPPADGPVTSGYDWIVNNYIKDGVQAGIAYSANSVNGVAYGVVAPKNGVISGNFIQNMTNFVGIDLEVGENDATTVTNNHIYSCVGGINVALNGYFDSVNRPNTKQVISSGGTMNTNAIQGRIAPSGKIVVHYTNGTTSLVSYTSVGTSSFIGITPAITVYGGETIYPYGYTKKIVISGNIIDDEDMTIPTLTRSATKYGIKLQGGHGIVEGNYVRYKGLAGGIRLQGQDGGYAFGSKVTDNVVVMCSDDTESDVDAISVALINASDIHGNTVIRENIDPTAGGMGSAVVVNNCNDVDVQDNRIFSPGKHGVELQSSTNIAITGNTIVDAGSQAGATAADISIASDCFNVRVNTNKTRWSGAGYQKDYGVWVRQGGGQDISVVNNWLHDTKTAPIQDDQSLNAAAIPAGGTVPANGNLKVSSASNIPVNGGRVLLNSVPQMYTAFFPTVTCYVNGAQTVSSGGSLAVSSNSNMPSYGTITVDGVSHTYTSLSGGGTLLNLVPGGTYTGGETIVATNVMTGLTTGGTFTGSETFSITGNSVPIQYLNRFVRNAQPYVTNYGMKELLSATAAPTTGTWARGDFIRNTTPSAGGTWGWVCTTAGTPGTWKAISIAA